MRYGIIDERTVGKETEEEFSDFDALVDYFEPDERLEGVYEKWEDIQDLYDLEQFINFCNNGEAGYKVVEIPEDADILKDSGLCDEDIKAYLNNPEKYTIYEASDIVPNYEEMILGWGFEDDEEREEEIKALNEMISTGEARKDWGISKGLDQVYVISFVR